MPRELPTSLPVNICLIPSSSVLWPKASKAPLNCKQRLAILTKISAANHRSAQANLVDFFLDVGKPSVDQPVLVLVRHPHSLSELFTRFNQSIALFDQIWCPLDGFVVAEDPHRGIGHLQPAPRL